MKLPNTLEELGKILKAAIGLEFGTPAGKIDSWGMFLAIVLIALGTLTGLIEDVIRIWRPKAVAPPTDFIQLFLIFVILVVACVILVALNDRKGKQ